MAISRVRMFAGPNGSGKSELIQQLQESELPLGPIINADNILVDLQKSGFIDLQGYRLFEITQQDWDSALREIDELSSRVGKMVNSIPPVKIEEDMLICDGNDLEASYAAALISDFLRYKMLDQMKSFSFETVMSHPGKIDFLKSAKSRGFKTYLYFIATDDPEINVSRVMSRVKKGGHPVPEDKIVKRYKRSLEYLDRALRVADRAYVLDNSEEKRSILFEKRNDGKGYLQDENIPRWFEKAVIEKN